MWFWSASLLLPLVVAAAAIDQYCGGNTPLSTPYFRPFYETKEPAVGCVSPDVTGQLVHVVRVTDTAKDQDISLAINHGKGQSNFYHIYLTEPGIRLSPLL